VQSKRDQPKESDGGSKKKHTGGDNSEVMKTDERGRGLNYQLAGKREKKGKTKRFRAQSTRLRTILQLAKAGIGGTSTVEGRKLIERRSAAERRGRSLFVKEKKTGGVTLREGREPGRKAT